MNQTAPQPRHLHGEENQTEGPPTVTDDDTNIDAYFAKLEVLAAAIEAGTLKVTVTERLPDSLETLLLNLPGDQTGDSMHDSSRPTHIEQLQEAKDERAKRGGNRIPHLDPGSIPDTAPKEGNVIATSTPDLNDVDPMHEAKDLIAKVMDTSKAALIEVPKPTERVGSVDAVEPVMPTAPHAEAISSTKRAPSGPPASPCLTPRKSAVYLVENYNFPDGEMDYVPATDHAALVDELKSLVQQFKEPDDYLRIRDPYCRVAEELNLRGLWAPAFRPDLQIPWKAADRKPEHTLIQRDRIVLDCHWLHSQRCIREPAGGNWLALLKVDAPFPFELAADFARRNMANEYRADAVLGLRFRQQFQLRALRGMAVEAQIKAIDEYRRVDHKRVRPLMETITLAVNRWCEQDPRVEAHRKKYLDHARARALLTITSPTWKDIAALAGLIQGIAPLGDGTVREFMGKLDKKMTNSA